MLTALAGALIDFIRILAEWLVDIALCWLQYLVTGALAGHRLEPSRQILDPSSAARAK